ncbi:DMT family transporter [Macrococcus capreoli]|uniref:DMT family transporter n=1 Tax=Macrococcus capreoli TaxID=2982690 RepID=UPI0021D5ABB3|nr:DMT family transporter [Macrococcus sp. TMW 2.2395]MCU7558271.1 DMT family transporter [Macrococcus sp. TMW 2.2395]
MKFIHILLLIVGVLALSSSAIFVKVVDAPVEVTAFYRMFIAFIIMLVMMIRRDYRSELRSLSNKAKIIMSVSGIVLAVHYLLWFESLQYTSVASSTVIVTLQPIFAVIGGYYIFRERYSIRALSGVLLAVIGCIVIGYNDLKLSGIALYGDLLAFIAALVITVYFYVGQYVRVSTSLVVYSILSYGSSALTLLLINILRGNNMLSFSATTWMAFIGLAVFATIMGQSLFNYLIKWLSTTVISMSILGEVVGTVILSYLFLGEFIRLSQLIGIGIILLGQVLFIIATNRDNESKS